MSPAIRRCRWSRPARLAAALQGLVCAGCSEFGIVGQDDVVTEPVWVWEEFVQASVPRLDILWVVDDTGSMAAEHEALASALPAFLDALGEAELAWQLGVVTTDVASEEAGVLRGNPWILTPTTDGLDAALSEAMTVGTGGAEPTAGLGAAWLALTEPLASGENRGFRRDDAGLHVIVFSDGDDASEDLLGDDPSGAFVDFLADEADRTGHDAVLSAVVGDRMTGCSSADGRALPGDTYLDVAEATGGATSTICEPDLSGIASVLGRTAIEWTDRFPLQEAPADDDVRVEVDGLRLDEGWSIEPEPPTLVFEEAPAPGAVIRVRYAVSAP